MLTRIVERFDVALKRTAGCRPQYTVSFHLNVNESTVNGSVCEINLVDSDQDILPSPVSLTGVSAQNTSAVETIVRVNGMPNLVAVVRTIHPLGEVVPPHYALALH